jgi:hypothetical protein
MLERGRSENAAWMIGSGGTGIRVAEVERALAFYAHRLGFAVVA